MIDLIPTELQFGGIYVPPALIVGLLGLIAAWTVTRILNWTRLARFFWNPPLVLLSLWALMSALIGLIFLAP